MVQDLAQLIPALQAAKKSLQAIEPLTREQRVANLAKLAEVWGTTGSAAALAAESNLSEQLVQQWDFQGAAEFLKRYVARAQQAPPADSKAQHNARGVISLLQPRFHGPRLFIERFAPAYLAGNPVLIKMSSKTPTASALVEEWLGAAGIPAEHAVVVAGASSDYANLMIKHPAVSAVSAVGRRETLLAIYKDGADLGRAFQGFAGGRATMFVMDVQDADGWVKLLRTPLQDGGGQRPYDNLRVFVLEKDEKTQLANLEQAMPQFPGARVSGHLTQCSEDHQAEALGPVILFSSIKYPFDLAKWVNNASTGFAVQMFGPRERLEKIVPKLDVGAILVNQAFDPAESVLFGTKESVIGDTQLSSTGSFFSQRTFVRGL